ncbi:MAG: tRNA (N6-isopentenyl adenosine(37)-C2)-methylthiotransferase MiaB [Deltaproteobacteria bacterium]|nr:tRNA (N6-isopentenyl adenosine(37)-C2)-methylthiotransferase MiaB [Deltaproteobacteria bacterium]
MSSARRLYIRSFGCQMNDYDAERIREILRRRGYQTTDDAEEADLVLLNTCSIREKAEAKVSSAAASFRGLKGRRPDVVLAVAGCVAQQEGARLLERLPQVDLVFGPDNIGRCADLVERVRESRRRVAVTDVIDVEDYTFLSADPRPEDVGTTVLVTIQKGCDNHCAYCVVPAVRGREVSRPLREVVAEVERFVAAGAREVTLIGQNVDSYRGAGGGTDDFVTLLVAVARVPGLLRLRFTTSHPRDFTPALARAFHDLPVLQGWLHLPVQAGSSRVLAAMGRGYTREEYLAKVDLVRGLVPEIALTTDVIVGFPGETADEHRETLSLLEAVEFESIYSFAYSARPGTPAAALRDDVPLEEKRARLHQVQALQQLVTARRLARLVGRRTPVLVEGESRRGEQVCGRTPGNIVVNFAPAAGTAPGSLRGRIVPVHVTAAGTHTLRGEPA